MKYLFVNNLDNNFDKDKQYLSKEFRTCSCDQFLRQTADSAVKIVKDFEKVKKVKKREDDKKKMNCLDTEMERDFLILKVHILESYCH